jgi:nickel transport protein
MSDPPQVGCVRPVLPRASIQLNLLGSVVALFFLVAIPSGEALAHKLQVFAFAEGMRIAGSTYFAGGGAASGARIEVRDDAGSLLAELAPDGEGRFVYEAQAPIAHRILAITGDGHRAEWRITADELAEDLSEPMRSPPSAGSPVDMSGSLDPQPHHTAPPPHSTPSIDPALEAAIERAVARQIRPLREQLVAAEDHLRLKDILGGLGYILGLTGLALWWRSRAGSTGS